MVIIGSILRIVFMLAISYGTVLAVEKQRKIMLSRRKLAAFWMITAAAFFAVDILSSFENMIWEMVLYDLFFAVFLVIAITDLEQHVIPNKLLLGMLLVWIGMAGSLVFIMPEKGLAYVSASLLGAFVSGMIFLLCYLFSKGQMGAGDVKLATVMGLYLTGDKIIGAVFYGIVLCLLYSLLQLVRKRIGLKDGVPLAPFLYLGTVFTYVIMA